VNKIAASSVAVLAAFALAGCFSLFPKADPAQLYRIGTSVEASAGAAGTVPLALAPLDFNEAAAGDRILTATGGEVAYIAASRWASPAKTMFHDALEQAFERNARVVTLVTRREVRASTLMLDVDVNAFEARYESGQGAAPTAVVSMDVRLVRYPERTVVGRRVIEAKRPAAENRVGAIVSAFDAATNDALVQLVQWTDQTAG